MARLKTGVSREAALADLDSVTTRLAEEEPRFKGWVMNVTQLHEYLIGTTRTPLLITLAAVGFVLLVACANVANLLLARVMARQREISIRLALGSSRSRIVRQMLSESVVIAMSGGALGAYKLQ